MTMSNYVFYKIEKLFRDYFKVYETEEYTKSIKIHAINL